MHKANRIHFRNTYSPMPVATTSLAVPRATVAAKYYELAIHHVTLYDPTGDVVLVARGSDGVRQLFRVHSTAFGHWEALLKALNAHGNVYYRTSEGVENGPCVEMDDKADDVAAFLNAHILEATEVLCVLSAICLLSVYSYLTGMFGVSANPILWYRSRLVASCGSHTNTVLTL